ncbi:MAG: diguanylate cyclase [Hydrococcus sp. Prado102]|jgi:diguanylate cyclase (GGDEF)-like protein/PAS domain S-box-containing protein|nr:diguanylate cyclase [Hydrococcus sp. Prado102]
MSDNLKQGYKASIIIVENDLENLRTLSNRLVKEGYRVSQASDRETALRAIATMLPDLILLEIEISPTNGYELCQQLKAKETTQEIPVIFLNNLSEKIDLARVFAVGGADYIAKPYRGEEAIARIKTQLKLRYLQKQLQQLNVNEIVHQFHPQSQLSLQLLYRAIAATPNVVVIADARVTDCPIIYVNPKFEQMTGYSASEVIGKNCRFLQGTDTKQTGLNTIRQALREQKECRVVLRNYRKDGSLFWNDLSISPIRDESGKVTHYIAVQTDITEYKRMEQERQKYQSSLQQMNLELYQLNQTLHRLANLDGLTGVANRRRFEEHLEQEWRRMFRESAPLSAILGDLDYFKRYNDTYGHLEGDDCLKIVASAISRVVNRPADLVARYGGEEFAIILPNTPTEGAMQVAQSIRQEVQKLRIPHQASAVGDYVTMSLGIATKIPTQELSAKELIEAADRALYQAKEQGRNCAVAHLG